MNHPQILEKITNSVKILLLGLDQSLPPQRNGSRLRHSDRSRSRTSRLAREASMMAAIVRRLPSRTTAKRRAHRQPLLQSAPAFRQCEHQFAFEQYTASSTCALLVVMSSCAGGSAILRNWCPVTSNMNAKRIRSTRLCICSSSASARASPQPRSTSSRRQLFPASPPRTDWQLGR